MIKNFISFLHNSECWKQVAIVFTRCSQTGKEKIIDEIDGYAYRDKVKDYIKTLPRCENISFELPCFFVNLRKWDKNEITKTEIYKIISLAASFHPIINNFAVPALTYDDSFDPKKVQEIIYRDIIKGQKQITTFAFGKTRTFDLDENGNVIIPVEATLKDYYEYHRNYDYKEQYINEHRITVYYDFVNMNIHPILKDQRLTSSRYHRIRNTLHIWFRKKTDVESQELIIRLGGDFLFQESKQQIFTLKSPYIDF